MVAGAATVLIALGIVLHWERIYYALRPESRSPRLSIAPSTSGLRLLVSGRF